MVTGGRGGWEICILGGCEYKLSWVKMFGVRIGGVMACQLSLLALLML